MCIKMPPSKDGYTRVENDPNIPMPTKEELERTFSQMVDCVGRNKGEPEFCGGIPKDEGFWMVSLFWRPTKEVE